MRFIGWIFIVLALIALTLDINAWTARSGLEFSPLSGAYWSELWAQIGTFELRVLGLTWSDIHRSSLQTLQPAIERHVHPELYSLAIRPLLLTPAVLLLGGIGIGLLLISRLLGLRSAVRI